MIPIPWFAHLEPVAAMPEPRLPDKGDTHLLAGSEEHSALPRPRPNTWKIPDEACRVKGNARTGSIAVVMAGAGAAFPLRAQPECVPVWGWAERGDRGSG